jgi:hypothetical protein
MKASITDLIAANPSGLLELKKPLSIPEYAENCGFNLKNIFTIYKSKKRYRTEKDWFAFGEKPLDQLFTVQEKSEEDLLVVFIVETMKASIIYCHLVLSNEAYKGILNDKNQQILQIHQMYTQFPPFGKDHIVINIESC